MLGGRHPFLRNSSTETLSAILRDDPQPLGRAQGKVPAAAERLVRHCLEKRPEDRFQTANDLALALEAVGAGGGNVRFAFDVEQDGVHASANAGPRGTIEGLVTPCPDGSCVVYRASQQGLGRLFLRRFDRLEATPLPGTERAQLLFEGP